MNLALPNAWLKQISPLKAFYVLYSMAVLRRIYDDFFLVHRQGIHAGDLYPFRNLLGAEYIYPLPVLYLEWVLALGGVGFVLLGKKRGGALLIFISMLASLTQYFQNQKVLLLLVSLALVIQPMTSKKMQALWFLKRQAALMYLFAGVQKIFTPFSTGVVLQGLLPALGSYSLPASWGVITAEVLLPLVLWKRPTWGFSALVALHLSFSLVLPNTWAFSFMCIGLGCLFFIQEQG